MSDNPTADSLYFRIRERIRLNPFVGRCIYTAQSLKRSNFGAFRNAVAKAAKTAPKGNGVALCFRIRDEGHYLEELLEYYLAAGISHFFFYEKLSTDNFREVLRPYVERGLVTVFEDWAQVPVSPSAEQDCILKSIGRFEWVGFIDADEFVVVKDGRSIPEFLSGYKKYPAVALHWFMFGSSGHQKRPSGPVIAEYQRREPSVNIHVKVFVRPEAAAACRNSHSWYYLGMKSAVNEHQKAVPGSYAIPPTAEYAWINHYHLKSEEDYFEKAARKSVLDVSGIKFPNRSLEKRRNGDRNANVTFDNTAVSYYLARCSALNIAPRLPVVPEIAR